MAKTDFKSINEYHEIFGPEIRERLETIRSIVKREAPAADEVISYQIPAFRYHGFLVYYSAFKGHISLSYPYSDALLSAFAGELSAYKVSKSAIQFPHQTPLPVDLIAGIVRFRVKENELKAAGKKG